MKVLLADEDQARANVLCDRLSECGYAVLVDPGGGSVPLAALIERHQPDVMIIKARSPTLAWLERLLAAAREHPLPVVVCAGQMDAAQAREVVMAGAQALVVGDPAAVDFAPVLAAARAQFEQIAHLKSELAEATRHLNERKLIERAKGILMKQRGMDEEQAYRALRSTAMERKMRLVTVAEQVINIAGMMG